MVMGRGEQEMGGDRERVGKGWMVMGRGDQEMDSDREGVGKGSMVMGRGWGSDGQ